MALADSPLIAQFAQREFRRGLLDAANKRVAEEQAGYEEAAAQPVALGPPPAEPDLMQRALATLGSNLATAASGREMFAERTSMAQMAEDAAYRQALAQRQSQEFEQNAEARRQLLTSKRDSAMQAAEAARQVGDHTAAAERQEEALKAANDLEKERQKFEKQQLNTRLSGEHTNRMAEISAESDARIQQIRANMSDTGDPAMDWVLNSAKINKMVAESFKATTGKEAAKDKKAFAAFKALPENAAVLAMIAMQKDKALAPAKGETPETWSAKLRAFGEPESEVQRIGKQYFPGETFTFASTTSATKAGNKGSKKRDVVEDVRQLPAAMLEQINLLLGMPPERAKARGGGGRY